MSIRSILNAFGDVTVSTIEKNAVLKTQLGNALRSAALWLATGFATKGYITNDHITMVAGLIVALGFAAYGNLKSRATKRENIALQNSSPINPGDTLPAAAAKPQGA